MTDQVEQPIPHEDDPISARIAEIDEIISLTRLKLATLRGQKSELLRAKNILSYPADHILHTLDSAWSDEGSEVYPPIIEQHIRASESHPTGGRNGKMAAYLEVALTMASVNDGAVRVSDVAREVKRRGLSEAKHSSLSASIQKALSRLDSWVPADEPGVFRLLD